MNKDPDKLIDRAKYIQSEINKAKFPSIRQEELAEELFLSEKTIERDSKRDIPDKTGSKY